MLLVTAAAYDRNCGLVGLPMGNTLDETEMIAIGARDPRARPPRAGTGVVEEEELIAR